MQAILILYEIGKEIDIIYSMSIGLENINLIHKNIQIGI